MLKFYGQKKINVTFDHNPRWMNASAPFAVSPHAVLKNKDEMIFQMNMMRYVDKNHFLQRITIRAHIQYSRRLSMINMTSSATRGEEQYCISEPAKKLIPWIIIQEHFRTKNSTIPTREIIITTTQQPSF